LSAMPNKMKKSNPATPMEGESLRALRQKILTLSDIHTNAKPPELARLILAGRAPPQVKLKTLIQMVRRTLANKGNDGRRHNGRQRWVRTGKLIESVKKAKVGDPASSLRKFAEKKGCSHDTIWKIRRQDIKY